MISSEQLQKIFPSCKKQMADFYAEAFRESFQWFNVTTKGAAALLGQIGVESGELKYVRELPSKWNKKNVFDSKEPVGSLYEGRQNLGNKIVGDGPKFIGRGLLQLTGRANYESMSKKIGFDLVNNPELAANPKISVKIACVYFKERGLFELAEKWDLVEITRRVNGNAKLHLEQRIKYSETALKVLTENV